MHLKHLLSQDQDKRTATLLLYGEIGGKVDGDYLASEIRYLEKDNDEIVLRINSAGGSVIQGLSIFNAILNSTAFVTVHIDGIAASMAGVIPMAADRVLMNDFARIMIHAPFFSSQADYTKLSKKERKMVDNAKGILISLLMRKGMDAATSTKYIEEETWFTAEEAKAAGMIDEIIPTGKKVQVEEAIQNLAALAPQNFDPFIQQPKPNHKAMNTISAFLGLEASATEAQVLNEIQAIRTERDAFKTKVDTLTQSNNDLQAKIDAHQAEEITALVDKAIAGGHFDPSAKDALTASAKADIVNFRTLVAGLKPITASLADEIKAEAMKGKTAEGGQVKDFEYYRRNDPQALAEMRINEPAKFQKLHDEWQAANA